jgi:hypothetical protein
MKKITYSIIFLILAGCAGVTEVVSTGKDTYMIASHGTMGWSSGGAQKANGFNQANEFCKKMGMVVEVISSSDSGSGGFGKISSAQIDFRCVNK